MLKDLLLLWKHYKLLKQENIDNKKLIQKLQDDNIRLTNMLVKSISSRVEIEKSQKPTKPMYIDPAYTRPLIKNIKINVENFYA